jgi:thioredoxin reductase (NADPH)
MEVPGVVDIAIVGGGPAGLTAGIYALRSGRSVLLLEQLSPGGQAATTWQVDNYPGLPHINGAELMMKMEAQARELGLQIRTDQVVNLEPGNPHRLVTSGEPVHAKTVVIATGAKPKLLGIPGEEKFRGQGVSYCATCDAAFFRGLPVAVIGGGNTALEEAEFLTRFATKVYLIHRREQFRADQILQDQVLKHPKIEVLTPFVVKEILGDEQGVESIMMGPTAGTECRRLSVKGVFIFTGVCPQNEAFKECLKMDRDGFIQTAVDLQTSQPGVFAAGDCRTNLLKQIVVATGEGATAAIMADRYLHDKR